MRRDVVRLRPNRAVIALLLAVGLTACGIAGSTETVDTLDLRPTTTINALTEPRDPFLWPFSPDSPWNMPIGSGAQYSRAGDEVTMSLTDRRIDIWLNSEEFSHPVVSAATSDPVLIVNYEGTNVAPFTAGTVEIHMPVGANPATGPDSHLHVIDVDSETAHEFFGYTPTATGATATYYVRNSLRGDGISDGGTRAYGGSALGGLVRLWELEGGTIPHALAVALTGGQLRQGPTWPATAEDANSSDTYRGPIPMGTLMAIPKGVAVDAMVLSEPGRIVAKALQDYGGYVVDQARSMTLYAELGVPPEVLTAIREDLPRIRRELRVVTNNGPNTVGGGGEPLLPLAPPLG